MASLKAHGYEQEEGDAHAFLLLVLLAQEHAHAQGRFAGEDLCRVDFCLEGTGHLSEKEGLG